MLNGGKTCGARDAVVVGGGAIGLSVARELARRGLSVALVERGALGAESSWAAAGMLAPQCEADARDAFFDLACASRDAYPAFADALREETGLDIELDRTGTLYLATTDEDEREIARRHDWQRRAGLAVELLTADEARSLEPRVSTRARAALRFPRDWQVENRRLVEALALSCERAGVRILEHTAALSVGTAGGRVSSVETARGTIPAGAVVVACGAWSSQVAVSVSASEAAVARPDGGGGDAPASRGGNGVAAPRVEPVRGQMLCFDAGAGGEFARHVLYGPRGYVVPRRGGRLLAGSTTERAGFDKSVTDEGRAEITAHAAELAPAILGLKLTGSWAGLRPRGADDWPVIGPAAGAENLFHATAHYRNGILLAPLTGSLVAEMIDSGATPAALAPFSPSRFRRAAFRAVSNS